MILSGTTKLAGILGWPVAHSRSPRLHGHWIRRHGLDAAYVPLPTPAALFPSAVRGLAAAGFRGANVTLPHKEAAFAVCDHVSDRALRAGAVNTLVFSPNGIEGDCTDGWGWMQSLPAGFRPDAGPAVLLGSGGSARQIAASLLDAGCPRVTLVNRDVARAGRLAGALGGPVVVVGWPDVPRAMGDAAILVNTTSLGMAGQPPLVLDLAPLGPSAIVADIVYVPRMTPLLRAASARDLTIVGGLPMLLHQARPGFAAWFGVMPEVDAELERFVGSDIEDHAC